MDTIKEIPLKDLLLDTENPRIYEDAARKKNQRDLAEHIYKTFGIEDLKDSFLKNGYFAVEPMIGFPQSDKYVVAEGNRRLTTLKILCDSEYRNHIIQEPKRESFTASDEVREKLQNIPVAIIESREEVHQYFAIKHLTGIRKWTPFAQAKYVFNELRKLIKEIKNIAGAIQKLEENTNIREKEVLHKYYQYALYKEFDNIIRDKQKNPDDYSLIDKFSLLEVSLGQTGGTSIGRYLSITPSSRNPYKTLAEDNIYEDIIREENYDKAMHFLNWVFKTKEPTISESREINSYLKPILRSPVATEAFESGAAKEDALLLAKPPQEICVDSCVRINKELVSIEKHYSKINPDKQEDIKKRFKTSVLEKADIVKRSMNIEE